MYFADALVLDAPRRLEGGAMAVRARSARTGVYSYTGREVDPDNKHGLRDQASVNVLRDADTVFADRSVRSFIGKPITDDHPGEAVTADNWRQHARGTVMGAMRDGDYLAFDLLLTDADAIAKVEGGKRELSNGYSASLEFGDFKGPNGEACPVRQAAVTGNHVAIVSAGRAGPSCRIGDAAPCASAPQRILDSLQHQEKPVKTMLIDGLTVDVANPETAMATIQTLVTARDGFKTKVGEHETTIAARDTEIATLKTENQQLKDAKPTPAQLRDAAKAYAQVVGKAKAIGVNVTDAMDEAAIMKAAVTKVMGDAAKDWNDAQIAASFAVVTKDAKVDDAASRIVPINAPQIQDAAKEATDARSAMIADMLKPAVAA